MISFILILAGSKACKVAFGVTLTTDDPLVGVFVGGGQVGIVIPDTTELALDALKPDADDDVNDAVDAVDPGTEGSMVFFG
jgi:hypothetical protein